MTEVEAKALEAEIKAVNDALIGLKRLVKHFSRKKPYQFASGPALRVGQRVVVFATQFEGVDIAGDEGTISLTGFDDDGSTHEKVRVKLTGGLLKGKEVEVFPHQCVLFETGTRPLSVLRPRSRSGDEEGSA